MKTDHPIGIGGKLAINIAQDAARMAGTILKSEFGGIRNISYKGRGNIVTEMDTKVESAIFEILGREFPNMYLAGEESASDPIPAQGYSWIVDPLDGTRNYASGIPFFSVVVGLVHDGEVLLGVNYDPMLDEMFSAARGEGAFLNGKSLSVGEGETLNQCILGMDMSYNNEGAANGLEVIQSIWPGMQTLRVNGSSALGISYVAAGRTDLYFNHQLAPWDQVAGLILVEEAGGVSTDRSGNRATIYSDGIIATTPSLLNQFMEATDGMSWREPTH